MKVFILCLTIFAFKAFPIEILKILPQNVLVWNNINLTALKTANSDLTAWCKSEFKMDCSGHDVSAFINTNQTVIYYQFSLIGVEDVLAVYHVKIDSQYELSGKSWISYWEYPFDIKPYKVSK